MTRVKPIDDTTQQAMANVIAVLLTSGVLLSAALLATGLVILVATTPAPSQFPLAGSLALHPQSLGDTIGGAVALNPLALIELGLLVLIATPVFRVAASIVLFLLDNDRLYAAITAAVLAVLLFSLFGIG